MRPSDTSGAGTPATTTKTASAAAVLIGKPLDSLTAAERWKYAGAWIALELYTPQSMPLRVIASVGASAAECITALRAQGLDPTRFEYLPLVQPYQP